MGVSPRRPAPRVGPMRPRYGTFLEILRSRNPLESDGFRLLREEAAAAQATALLRRFFAALNQELRVRLGTPPDADLGWVPALCLALVEASPEQAPEAVAELLDDLSLTVHEPLVSVIFEAAGDAPPLLAVVGDFVASEAQFVQVRARALEAMVTRSRAELNTGALGLDAQPALRFLNGVFEELGRGLGESVAESGERWAEGFKGLIRLFPEGEDPQALEWCGEALSRLASVPRARETMRLILRILRSNSPLPARHPGSPGASEAREPDEVGALIVDKALQIVLAAAAASWP